MSGGDLEFARELARASAVASLATLDPDGGPPHASFVTVALDRDLSPLLLLSGLALHRRNLEANPAAALLMTGEGRKVEAAADPLAGDRVTLRGTIAITDEPEDRSRFLSRHPAAADYAVSPISTFSAWRSARCIWSVDSGASSPHPGPGPGPGRPALSTLRDSAQLPGRAGT